MKPKETDPKVIMERWNKRLERQKEYNKKKYDYLSIVLDQGQKEVVSQELKSRGFKNVSEYFKNCLERDGIITSEKPPEPENINFFE